MRWWKSICSFDDKMTLQLWFLSLRVQNLFNTFILLLCPLASASFLKLWKIIFALTLTSQILISEIFFTLQTFQLWLYSFKNSLFKLTVKYHWSHNNSPGLDKPCFLLNSSVNFYFLLNGYRWKNSGSFYSFHWKWVSTSSGNVHSLNFLKRQIQSLNIRALYMVLVRLTLTKWKIDKCPRTLFQPLSKKSGKMKRVKRIL